MIVSPQLAHPLTPPHGVTGGAPDAGHRPRGGAAAVRAARARRCGRTSLIGVGVAAVLVGGVLGGRAFFGKRTPRGRWW